MKRTYLYLHHDGFSFFLENRELTSEEQYCKHCDASDTLVGYFDSETALAEQMRRLFASGYDLISCDDYLDIKDKYCPPELRLWELGQFEEGSCEYAAYVQRLKNAENFYWKNGHGVF